VNHSKQQLKNNIMPFRKNDSRINKNGRPKGSPNKNTDELRNVFHSFLEANLDSMQKDFDMLEAWQRLQFIERIAKMLLPPLVTIETTEQRPVIRVLNLHNENESEQPEPLPAPVRPITPEPFVNNC